MVCLFYWICLLLFGVGSFRLRVQAFGCLTVCVTYLQLLCCDFALVLLLLLTVCVFVVYCGFGLFGGFAVCLWVPML